jgi:ubiquinone/menaquinone biosynthesis C-methylase UbiE
MKPVPLPDEAIDIAVFSLSLMGRNWSDYIAEAKRCLATNGYLLMTETTKSVKGRMSTIRNVIKKQGFEITLMKRKEISLLSKPESFKSFRH